MSRTTVARLKNLIPGLDPKVQLRDAVKPMKVAPTRADAKRAQRLDPVNCLYGRACQRIGHPAVVFRNVAYVRQSAKLILKYQVPAAGRAQIVALDAAGIAVPGATIMLMPPKGVKRVGGEKGRRAKNHGDGSSRLTAKQLTKRRAERDALPPTRQLN